MSLHHSWFLFAAAVLLLVCWPASRSHADGSTIVINEFMPNPKADDAEWVELYNAGTEPIDIGGWAIADAMDEQAVFPASTIVSPKEFLVVTFDKNVLNNTGKETIWLKDNQSVVVDTFEYTGSKKDQSYARTPDGSDTWQQGASTKGKSNITAEPIDASDVVVPYPAPGDDMAESPTVVTPEPSAEPDASDEPAPTTAPSPTPVPPTATPEPVVIDTVVINEIMASSPEWIELYNNSDVAIDLAGWTIKRISLTGTEKQHQIDATVIAPQELLIIGFGNSFLNNDGATLLLYDAQEREVATAVDYPALKDGQVYARMSEGSNDWSTDYPPSPGSPNLAPIPTATVPPSPTRTPKPTNTPSPTRTPKPTNTPSPTRTPKPTKVPTLTRTPKSTKVPTLTRTPKPTKVPTLTRTPKPTKVPTPTRTPKAVAVTGDNSTQPPAQGGDAEQAPAAFVAATVWLSEILVAPKDAYSSEWVELYNPNDVAVDVSNWFIDDGDGGSTPIALEAGSVIPPFDVLLVALPKAMLNNSGDQVRLLYPDQQVVDSFEYAASKPDRSYSRNIDDGTWTDALEASPGWLNPTVVAADTAPQTANGVAVPNLQTAAASSPGALGAVLPANVADVATLPNDAAAASVDLDATVAANVARQPASLQTGIVPAEPYGADVVAEVYAYSPPPTALPSATSTAPLPTPQPQPKAVVPQPPSFWRDPVMLAGAVLLGIAAIVVALPQRVRPAE